MPVAALRRRHDADGTARTGPVVDDDRLPQLGAKHSAQHARRTVGAAARREGNDDAHGPGGPALLRDGGVGEGSRESAGERGEQRATGKAGKGHRGVSGGRLVRRFASS